MSTPDRKAQLCAWLQTALELELSTIPPYFAALVSIRLPHNREAAELVRGVMIEEMLHLALVANVLNAVGGAPRIDARTVPSYPLQMTFEGKAFANRRFPINLAPFGEDTLNTFLKIEEPENLRPTAEARLAVPDLTIGGFYSQIIGLIEALAAEGEGDLFTGRDDRQIAPDFYWASGGALSMVRDAASAKAALELVIQQGEGAWRPDQGDERADIPGSVHIGHYFRFNEILQRHRYRPSDDPAGPPTGDPIAVDFTAVDGFRPNPKASDYPAGSDLARLNDLFNRRYTLLLKQISEAFNGSPRYLYPAINDGMRGLGVLAHDMMIQPVPGDRNARTGCPTFDWVED